jgi:hypothetical protein
MPYTYKSLAFLVGWLITLGLSGLTASGVVAGSWPLVFLLVTLATSALFVSSQHPVGGIARSRRRPSIVSELRDRSALDLDRIDVYRWESEGGAPRRYVNSGRQT